MDDLFRVNGDRFILDHKNNIVFQKIFGSPENEDILISFLNAILEKNRKRKGNSYRIC